MKSKCICLWIAVLLLSSCGLRRSSPMPTVQVSGTSISVFPETSPTSSGLTLVSPTQTPLATPIRVENPTQNPDATRKATTDAQATGATVSGIHLSNPITRQQLALLKDAGVSWTRTDVFHWNRIQPTKSSPAVYDWSSVDEQSLQAAAADDLQFVAAVLYTPAWAQKNPGVLCGAVSPEAIDGFADFMGALVSRYSVPPYNVKYWEIGNEPDVDPALVPPDSGYGCWGDTTDAYYGGGYYASVLKAVYPKVKAANPDAQLIIGGLLLDCDPVKPPEVAAGSGNIKNCNSSRFLEGVLINGGAPYFDGVSLHSYDYYGGALGNYSNPNWHSAFNNGGPALIAKASYISSLLVAYRAMDKYLLGTELALLCGRDGTESICQTPEFEATKASYLIQAMTYAQAYHFRAVTWYGLLGWRASGLVTRSLEPLPAYSALKFYTAFMGSGHLGRSITNFTGVDGYEFKKDDQMIWILWSNDGGSHSISLPALPKQLFNVFGEAIPVQPKIDITTAPVYVLWDVVP